MLICRSFASLTLFAFLFALVRMRLSSLLAHCDGMDGPVVTTAKRSLENGDVRPTLMWVRREDESEIAKAFAGTRAVRALSPQAQELADTHFFETLVRVHRAGEGEPFTGLKPAGRDLGPAIPRADRALEEGSVEPLVRMLTEAVTDGVRDRFREALAKRSYAPDDVEAGRAYIEAYVQFIHYIEHLYRAATQEASGQFHEAAAVSPNGGPHHA